MAQCLDASRENVLKSRFMCGVRVWVLRARLLDVEAAGHVAAPCGTRAGRGVLCFWRLVREGGPPQGGRRAGPPLLLLLAVARELALGPLRRQQVVALRMP